jgi:hypothetical protein
MKALPQFELTVRQQDLMEEISWRSWIVVLIAGFICGATADLFSLWLFAHWMNP